MTQKNVNKPEWANQQDPVQAGVQFIIQWLAYLYPNCQPDVDAATLRALPFVDEDIKKYWQNFLDNEPLESHLEVLAWVGQNMETKQIPYIMTACWHLLLSQHQLPTLIPSALRILERIFGFGEKEVIQIGQKVRSELQSDTNIGVFQLESSKPDYIYQLEQKLLQESKILHGMIRGTYSDKSLLLSFITGAFIGAALLWSYQYYSTPAVLAMITPPVEEVQNAEMNSSELTPEPALVFPKIGDDADSTTENTTTDTVEESEPVVAVAVAEPEPEPEPEPTVAPKELKPAFKPRSRQIKANVLNLRAGPDSSAEVIARLVKGAIVTQVGLSEDRRWALVQIEGFEGYVGSFFLQAVDPSLPVPEQPVL